MKRMIAVVGAVVMVIGLGGSYYVWETYLSPSPLPYPRRPGVAYVYVTNLNDSGPGSFREAVTMEGPRVVIFGVSGVVLLRPPMAPDVSAP